MRLQQICRRKNVAFLLVLIATVSILWTYWFASRLHRHSEIPVDGFHFLKNTITEKNRDEDGVLQTNRNSVQENGFPVKRENSLWHSNVPYFLAKSKVTVQITDKVLLQKLQELEKKNYKSQFSEILLVKPLDSSQEQYVETLKNAFNVLGYEVVLLKDSSEMSALSISSWEGVWCFSGRVKGNDTSHCFLKDYLNLQQQKKMSPIPGFEKLLLRNEGFCYLMSASQQIPGLESKFNLSPPCYVLPAQRQKFSQDLDKKRTQLFTLKTLGPEATPFHKWGATDSSSEKIEGPLEAVLQSFPEDVALIQDKGFIVQVYVLVTSVSPLRVYRHHKGHVHFINNEQVTFDKWNLETFFEHLEMSFGKDRANQAIEWMDELVVKMLLLLEPSLLVHFTSLTAGKQSFRCKRCFQPLDISFAFTSALNPLILEVKAAAFDKVSHRLQALQDTVNLLFNISSNWPLSQDVYKTLKVLRETPIVKNSQCNQPKTKCWTDELLEYLLQTKQEALHIGNFKQLYPTIDGFKYKALMLDLLDTGVELDYDQRHGLRTSDVHDILTGFATQTSTKSWEYSSINRGTTNPRLSKGPVKEVVCNDEPDAIPVLLEVNTRPSVLLHPQFSSDVFSYQTTVSFDTMVLQIWGKTSTCHSDVQINTKYGNSQISNHSLGVGWNRFSIHVVDASQSTPDIVTTYSLIVFRKRRSEMEKSFDKDSIHQVCTHHQECSLKVFPSMPCGLEKQHDTTWNTFLWKQKELPLCETSCEPGRWVLPCASCDDSNSCYWKEAVWAPYTCHYGTLSRDETKTCLANKKILFVGDSTNRGIMYYLMEKLNGSLRKWEKTHTMKIYSDELNGRRTSVSFAYYPQFWLPENKRPVFVKALYQLIARFLPLENNTNTVLVVGGVQWMGAHHITETNKALTSLGLNGIKVIVKSLGSGFHLPVPGLHRHDLAGQRRTVERNQQVIDAAKRLGYQVVDTFGMTVSRYSDFLMGNCGCHFHKVVDMRSLIKEEDEVPSPLLENLDIDKETDLLPRYHVIGPINSVYSELVINRMCS